jgi:hypothetical protein
MLPIRQKNKKRITSVAGNLAKTLENAFKKKL